MLCYVMLCYVMLCYVVSIPVKNSVRSFGTVFGCWVRASPHFSAFSGHARVRAGANISSFKPIFH